MLRMVRETRVIHSGHAGMPGQKARELKFSGPAHEVARALVGSLEGAMMRARSFGEVSRFETAAHRALVELFK